MKRLILLALLALPLAAQGRFTVSTGVVTLPATTQGVTVQQPATSPGTIQLESAVVYCSVSCVITQKQNATTAATATAATPVAISPVGNPATATAWTASNASGGTTVPPVITLPAGQTVTIDLSKVTLPKGGATSNYTVSIGSITGDTNITITWRENAQ